MITTNNSTETYVSNTNSTNDSNTTESSTIIEHNLANLLRPDIFQEVVGQSHVVKGLSNMIKNNCVPKVVGLCGPPGIGKTTLARIFARAIQCENVLPDGNPCNTCATCTRNRLNPGISSIVEINCAEMDKEKILELLSQTKLPPMNSKRWIVILDEIQELHKAAKNSLLKPIEDHVNDSVNSKSSNEHKQQDEFSPIFIIGTSEPSKLDEAMKSRTVLYQLNPLSVEIITNQLAAACQHVNTKADFEALKYIAQAAKGCMRDAYTQLEAIANGTDYNINLQSIQPFNLTGYSPIAENMFNVAHSLDVASLQHALKSASYSHTFTDNDFICIMNKCEELLSNPQYTSQFDTYVEIHHVFLQKEIDFLKSNSHDALRFFNSACLHMMKILRHANNTNSTMSNNVNSTASPSLAVQQNTINHIEVFLSELSRYPELVQFTDYLRKFQLSVPQEGQESNHLVIHNSILNPSNQQYFEHVFRDNRVQQALQSAQIKYFICA